MPDYTSFIPPNLNTPEPQGPRWLGIIFTIAASVLFGGFIIFIGVESVMDWSGNPLSFAPVIPPKEKKDEVKPSGNVFEPSIAQSFKESLRPMILVTPKDKSRLASRETVIMAHWKPENPRDRCPLVTFDLWVDDYLVPWDMQFGSDTWFVKLPLAPGEHRIRTLAFDSDFYVEEVPPAKETTAASGDTVSAFSMSVHPGTDKAEKCGDCHRIEAGPQDIQTKHRSLTVGKWKGAESCYECHKRDAAAEKHKSQTKPLERCTDCHPAH
ncbi:MAG: cytochrome c3 family protein [Planctomycetaceae bacterium]|jgi:hypothetical protein|nr:cytochrome c3 family protein [Planctomycetaceae bacterium]